uniref:Uncharacterized protein n=1 Tax=Bacteriophage sp. TaxID=38018 RepID=A0A8D9UHL4_9VIRU|nr:MAG TPA: hypothetical protein [Bacteriophage sp.]
MIIFLLTWFTRSKRKETDSCPNYQSHLRHQTPVKSVYIITHRKEYIT